MFLRGTSSTSHISTKKSFILFFLHINEQVKINRDRVVRLYLKSPLVSYLYVCLTPLWFHLNFTFKFIYSDWFKSVCEWKTFPWKLLWLLVLLNCSTYPNWTLLNTKTFSNTKLDWKHFKFPLIIHISYESIAVFKLKQQSCFTAESS